MLDRLSKDGIQGSWRRATLLALVHSETAGALLDRESTRLLDNGAALLRELIRTVMAVDTEPASQYSGATRRDSRANPGGHVCADRRVVGPSARLAAEARKEGSRSGARRRGGALYQLDVGDVRPRPDHAESGCAGRMPGSSSSKKMEHLALRRAPTAVTSAIARSVGWPTSCEPASSCSPTRGQTWRPTM